MEENQENGVREDIVEPEGVLHQKSSSGKSRKWIVVLLIVIIVLAVAGTALFLWLSKGEGEDGGTGLGYDSDAVVVTDEDELQKMIDDMKAKDGQISLEYKNVASSSDGRNFSCHIVNSAKNKYDMYLGIYSDASYEEELYLTQLLKPGSGIKEFECQKELGPGSHNVVLVFTLVEDDHETIHSQTTVTYTLNVAG